MSGHPKDVKWLKCILGHPKKGVIDNYLKCNSQYMSLPSFQWGERFHNNTSLKASTEYKNFCPRKSGVHKMDISYRNLKKRPKN